MRVGEKIMGAVMQSTDLKTVLKLALPPGSRLLIGYPNTPINRVTHLRTRPPIFADLSGQELVLVSLDALAHAPTPLSLETVIERLTHTRASALGVQGKLPPRIQKIAREHNFPLVTLPHRAALPQIAQAVQRLLTDREAQMHQRAAELRQTLQRHAASYHGLSTMLNTLARALGRQVVLHNRQGRVLGRGVPSSHERAWDNHPALTAGGSFVRQVEEHLALRPNSAPAIVESAAGLSVPLVYNRRTLGYVSALSMGERPDEFDRLALEYCAQPLAHELTRRQSADAESVRAARDWVADWLSSPAADDELLMHRAGLDAFDPEVWYAVGVFQWHNAEGEGNITAVLERMQRVIRNELHQRRVHAPIGRLGDRVVVLFPLESPQRTQRLHQVVHTLRDTLEAGLPAGQVLVGVGRPSLGLTALRASFQEAAHALDLPEALWAEGAIARFGDVTLYDLLLATGNTARLAHFCEQWLSPLIAYDEQHHTDLLPTLGAYFANNGNMARTAHALNIHRNTLVYRLGRITEILQLDTEDASVRLNLHLALKIHRLLSAL